jgi:hypothetical protein
MPKIIQSVTQIDHNSRLTSTGASTNGRAAKITVYNQGNNYIKGDTFN